MKIKRKRIHYKISSSFLILGFVVSYICYFNCMNLYHTMNMKEQEQNKYKYINEIEIFFTNQGDSYRLDSILKSNKGNLIIKELWAFRDKQEAMGITDIILFQNEALQYPVIEGTLPKTDDEITEPTMILGIRQKDYTVEKDGKYYYSLEGGLYEVCAFIGSENSDLFDYSVIVYFNMIDGNMEDKLNKSDDSLSILIGSNLESVYPVYKDIKNTVLETNDKILFSALAENNMSMSEEHSGNINYYLIIFIFCVINSVIVSEYWIKERYKEIAIRKVFGFSDRKIFYVLYMDMVQNIVWSVIIALIIQGIMSMCFSDYLILYKSQIGYYIFNCILFVFILGAVIMIYPFLILRKEDVLKSVISNCS